MRNEAEDQDLIRAFEALKAEDARFTPSFEANVQERWAWRPLLPGIAAAAAVGLLFVFLHDRKMPVESAAQAIAFDELSDLISRELFFTSVSDWESPTQFLLNPEFETD